MITYGNRVANPDTRFQSQTKFGSNLDRKPLLKFQPNWDWDCNNCSECLFGVYNFLFLDFVLRFGFWLQIISAPIERAENFRPSIQNAGCVVRKTKNRNEKWVVKVRIYKLSIFPTVPASTSAHTPSNQNTIIPTNSFPKSFYQQSGLYET